MPDPAPNLFAENLRFLLKKNYEINKLNKTHFIHEIDVSWPTLSKWIHGGQISEKHLRRICEYFNRYLNLQLNQKKILNENLKLSDFQIAERNDYYISNLKRLFHEINSLSPEQITALLNLIQAFKTTK